MTGSIVRNKVLASILFITALLLVYHFFLVNVLRFPCQPGWVSYATFVLVIEAFFQVFWKPISPKTDLKETGQEEKEQVIFKSPVVDIPVKRSFLIGLWNNLSLNWPKKITATLFGLAILWIPVGWQISTVKETSPIVIEFTAQSINQPVLPGEGILVKGPTFISAKVDGACALPCRWQTINGKVEQREMCSAYYTPPGNGATDALTVIASSPCKSTQTQATIFITSAK